MKAGFAPVTYKPRFEDKFEMEAKRSGGFFIAYKGKEVSRSTIEETLNEICPDGYTIRSAGRIDENKNNVIFAKIVSENRVYLRDPDWSEDKKILTVNGYNQNEVERVYHDYGFLEGVYDPFTDCWDAKEVCHRFTNALYIKHKSEMFEKLCRYMHFCSVIWDENVDSIIAGVTEPNNLYTHLYYGYTKRDNEIMFSNNGKILQKFCDEIIEMDNNTYMKDGEIYTFDGEKYDKTKNPVLIKKIAKKY